MSSLAKTVVISGASSGIGYALALEFHAKQYNLILVARRQDRLIELNNKLNQIRSDSAEYRVCDLADRNQSKKLASELSQLSIFGLVNNAGRGSLGSFADLDLDLELEQIELNVNAPLILSHAVLPRMIKTKNGFIINVSSIMAYQAVPYVATYAATKSFEWLHSVALARELEDYGIRVLTLCPGPTETEFFGVAKVSSSAASFKRASAQSVAKACVRDLESGKTVCIPNYQAWLLAQFAKFTPWHLYTSLVKRLLRKTIERNKVIPL
jgi:short-subunit dehydrogenase